MLIGIIGLGFVGSALQKSFGLKCIDMVLYDKYKNGGIGSFRNILNSTILFLCLPTKINEIKNCFNMESIEETCNNLSKNNFKGLVVIKSTIEINKTEELSNKFVNLKLCHNPEFLTARTAFEDFHNQRHIVLGKGKNCKHNDMMKLKEFYEKYYEKAEISLCCSNESESMKLMCNSYYAAKIMIFNEFFLFCKNTGGDYNKIKNLMLKNEWINHMHTLVPGPDKKLGFGGECLPKDSIALCNQMEKYHSPNQVLKSVIYENKQIR